MPARSIVDWVAEVHGMGPSGAPPFSWSMVRSFWAKRGIKVAAQPTVRNVTCEIRHPGMSCLANQITFWPQVAYQGRGARGGNTSRSVDICGNTHLLRALSLHLSVCEQAFRRAFSVYLPVHVIPALTFGLKRTLAQPGGTLMHLVAGISRSSAFLATYVAFARH